MKNNNNIIAIALAFIAGIFIGTNAPREKGFDHPYVLEILAAANAQEIQKDIESKVTGFQVPMVFMGIQIDELDPKAKNPIAEVALGIKDGEKFPKERIISEFELSSGTSLYEIKPILPYEKGARFFITRNNVDKIVESVRITQTFNERKIAIEKKDNLVNIIKENYLLVFEENNVQYFKNKYGDLITIHLNHIDGEYELRFLYIASHNTK